MEPSVAFVNLEGISRATSACLYWYIKKEVKGNVVNYGLIWSVDRCNCLRSLCGLPISRAVDRRACIPLV